MLDIMLTIQTMPELLLRSMGDCIMLSFGFICKPVLIGLVIPISKGTN